jgi:predicted TPR repeat methyltransferase
LSIDNFQPSAINILGSLELKKGNFAKAIEWYKCAISFKPDMASAHSNLGNALKLSGKTEDAIKYYNQAIFLDPNYSDAYSNLAGVYLLLDRVEDSISMCNKALQLNPVHEDALQNLGAVYLKINDIKNALNIYQKLSLLNPEHPTADFIINTLRGNTIDKPPQRYISTLFNGYAEDFENHLVNKLNYQLPQQLINLLNKNNKLKFKQLIALDIGCGTGLVGPLIKNNFYKLIGVDLSQKMLQKAKDKNCYTKLIEGDISNFVIDEKSDTYDMVIACDTLNYFGDLCSLFKSIKNILKNEGIFVFTLEKCIDSNIVDYKLNTNGRYQHNKEHILKLITDVKFNICDIAECVGRQERNVNVVHLSYILTK